jgi:hypothetical protein
MSDTKEGPEGNPDCLLAAGQSLERCQFQFKHPDAPAMLCREVLDRFTCIIDGTDISQLHHASVFALFNLGKRQPLGPAYIRAVFVNAAGVVFSKKCA